MRNHVVDCTTAVDHPLVKRHITELRDIRTTPEQFRRALRRLAVLLAYEATKELTIEPVTIETPLTQAIGHRLSQKVGVVPILRAGLGMVDPVLDLLPEAQVWHLGLYRDETTAEPVEYYSKLPDDRTVDIALVLDPMLATGGSVLAALDVLQAWGVGQLKVLSVIGSRQGIERVVTQCPTAQIYICAIDDQLNDRKFIVPGLGDAGDRTFNTLD